MRTFVTGASGAPFKAVVRSVTSRAAAPVPSNATAASFNDTRFSTGSAGVVPCALTITELHKTTRKAATFFMTGSPRVCQDSLLANHRIDQLVDRLAVLRDTLSHPAFENISRFLQHARRSAIPIKHVRVKAADIVMGKRVIRHGN